ncbi:hypothetical protein AT251_12965 [Enterovibrio nigricans]|uniref:Uncharacterized protein n=2 Tax=Enterovibrio nigricans TaxID=504469 RepID=A0A1T4V9T0_9GAMM|nr:hypothetical protein [Enterovibrio nigricans]PKF50222.1 hypothetical protein AT251_12965 [Enterovibrio nigricans]SKA61281.1 hypothetical protein SAMN02745132_03457 [Enterovibrio nigricans DSM 22720]
MTKRCFVSKNTFFLFLQKIHALPNTFIDVQTLDVGRGLEKQLDEHRELLEAIEKETGYFSSERGFYSIGHAETLDDYLSYLYQLRFGKKAASDTAFNYLRVKPPFIQSND